MNTHRAAGAIPRRQRGGALLALVPLVAGASLLWLTSPSSVPPPDIGEARRALLQARRALLAHVAAFPESYGPEGAGPAHLPCPDTDTPLAANTSPALGAPLSPLAGDGPNPPCGDGALAIGRLPRHVSLPTHRELFHGEIRQRFVYAVSTRVINNPLDRIVDPNRPAPDAAPDAPIEPDRSIAGRTVAIIVDTGGAALPSLDAARASIVSGDPRDLLAAIRDEVARVAGAGAARALAHVSVDGDELLAAARRRVAAWFVANLRRPAKGVHCARYTSSALLLWLGDTSTPTPEPVPELPGGTSPAPVSACDVTPRDLPAMIQGAPRERHWFVRNRWHRFVSLDVDTVCQDEKRPCVLSRLRDDAQGLLFALSPRGIE